MQKETEYRKFPVGYLQIGDVKEKDFLKSLSNTRIREISARTYGRVLRQVLLFARQNSYSIKDVIKKPEQFFMEFAEAKGLTRRRMQSLRSIFFRYIVPFLKREAKRGKDIVGEISIPEKKKEKEKKPEKKTETEVETLPFPPAEVRTFFEKMMEEIRHELRKAGEVEEVKEEEELKSLGFPCIILFFMPGSKRTVHIVALEKIAEDRQLIKVRGFMVEKWAEDIAQYERYEKRRGGSRPQPQMEIYALPKKNIVLVKEIEEGVHEPNTVIRRVEPLLRKLLRAQKPSYPEQESLDYLDYF